jgi:hypothetical protein
VAAGLNLLEEFVTLFNNLKEAAGNTPERVPIFYKDSKAIRDALESLHAFLARTDLKRRVFHGRKLFRTQRAAGFESAWKEYDAKWRFQVIWPEASLDVPPDLDELLASLDADVEPDPSTAQDGKPWTGEQIEPEPPIAEAEPDGPDPEFEDSFDPRSHDGGAAIELGITQLEIEADSHGYAGNSCRLALGAYDYLTETIGLNIRSVFRRWRKVPVVFVPAHVSNRYGATDKGSLLHLLNDAVRAYVFGAPAAAVAMCRAALETVLKRHYGHDQWEDVKLGQLVVLASQRYDFVQEKRITPLVQKANRILHDYAQADRISPDDDRTILNFLKTVKFLIQRAPER